VVLKMCFKVVGQRKRLRAVAGPLQSFPNADCRRGCPAIPNTSQTWETSMQENNKEEMEKSSTGSLMKSAARIRTSRPGRLSPGQPSQMALDGPQSQPRQTEYRLTRSLKTFSLREARLDSLSRSSTCTIVSRFMESPDQKDLSFCTKLITRLKLTTPSTSDRTAR
jgi:hypothetical protein